jgi:hypothetical protein
MPKKIDIGLGGSTLKSMHIYYLDKDNTVAGVDVPITWDYNAIPGPTAEVRGHKFTSIRHRTNWGWCWFDVECKTLNYTHNGDLPKHILLPIPLTEALASEPCPCGCTESIRASLV